MKSEDESKDMENPFFNPFFRLADDFHPDSHKGKRKARETSHLFYESFCINFGRIAKDARRVAFKMVFEAQSTYDNGARIVESGPPLNKWEILAMISNIDIYEAIAIVAKRSRQGLQISTETICDHIETVKKKNGHYSTTLKDSNQIDEPVSSSPPLYTVTLPPSPAVLDYSDFVRVCPQAFFGFPPPSRDSPCVHWCATLPFDQWCSQQLPKVSEKNCGDIRDRARHIKYNGWEIGHYYYTILRAYAEAEDKKYPTTKCEEYEQYYSSAENLIQCRLPSGARESCEAKKIGHDDVPEHLLKKMYFSSSSQPNSFAPFDFVDNDFINHRAGWDSFRCEFGVGRRGIVLQPNSGFRACFSAVIPAVQCSRCADKYNLKETDPARVTHIPFFGLTTSTTFPEGDWLAMLWKMNGNVEWSKRLGDDITTTDTDLLLAENFESCWDTFSLFNQEFAHTCEIVVCCQSTPRVYYFLDYDEIQYDIFPAQFHGREFFPCFPMSLYESIQTPHEFKHQFTQTGGKPFDE